MNLKHVSSGGDIPTARNVLINETTFTFEPDEEGNYRALAVDGQAISDDFFPVILLQTVAEKLAVLSNQRKC